MIEAIVFTIHLEFSLCSAIHFTRIILLEPQQPSEKILLFSPLYKWGEHQETKSFI